MGTEIHPEPCEPRTQTRANSSHSAQSCLPPLCLQPTAVGRGVRQPSPQTWLPRRALGSGTALGSSGKLWEARPCQQLPAPSPRRGGSSRLPNKGPFGRDQSGLGTPLSFPLIPLCRPQPPPPPPPPCKNKTLWPSIPPRLATDIQQDKRGGDTKGAPAPATRPEPRRGGLSQARDHRPCSRAGDSGP